LNNFLRELELEIRRQEKYLSIAKKQIALSPQGGLSVRQRKKKTDYYQNIEEKHRKAENRKRRQININGNPSLIFQLTEKLIQQKVLPRSRKNLFYLKKLHANYMATDFDTIASLLPKSYQHVLTQRRKESYQQLASEPYPKAKFDPRYHTHETDSGEMVRSKSEQIILNTLFAYPLVVHYEEEFLYKHGVPGINRVYPDFTIILPDGSRILWEHLGRLDDPGYCQRVAAKLNLYQKNSYIIGKNLILTMDDDKGNISSALVIDAIEHYILPYIKTY